MEPIGLAAEERNALEPLDASYYQISESGESSSAEGQIQQAVSAEEHSDGSSDSDSSIQLQKKRVDYGEALGGDSSESVPSELSAASDSDDGAGTTGQGSVDHKRALIAADIRDLKSSGCSCKGKNHYESLSPKLLEELMFSAKQLQKFCLFEVLFYIANQTGIDAQYYDGDRIKSVAR